MRQFFDKLSLIHIDSVVHAYFFKCLNADWQVSRFVHKFNIAYFFGIVSVEMLWIEKTGTVLNYKSNKIFLVLSWLLWWFLLLCFSPFFFRFRFCPRMNRNNSVMSFKTQFMDFWNIWQIDFFTFFINPLAELRLLLIYFF